MLTHVGKLSGAGVDAQAGAEARARLQAQVRLMVSGVSTLAQPSVRLPKQHTRRASHTWVGQLGQRHRSQRTGDAESAGAIQHVVPVLRLEREDEHAVPDELRTYDIAP